MQQAKLYLPVENVKLSDLYDWSDPEQQCKRDVISVKPNGLLRQNSRTGALVNTNEKKIALFRHGEKVFAVNEKCPHLGGPLHLGDVEELPDRSLCVKCPWHSWKFDLKTGQIKYPKQRAVTAVVYPVRVKEDGTIYIGFEEFDSKYFNTDCEF